MSATPEWKPCGCGHAHCTALFVDGQYQHVGTFDSGRHVQWFGPKGKTGLESPLVAAQDMALRECGYLKAPAP